MSELSLSLSLSLGDTSGSWPEDRLMMTTSTLLLIDKNQPDASNSLPFGTGTKTEKGLKIFFTLSFFLSHTWCAQQRRRLLEMAAGK